MLILVTNDDGIHAPGILTLSRALGELGRVLVVAPDRERSAASHSLTLNHPLRIDELGEDRYAIDGTPTDCVHLATHVLLEGRKPDLVVSGINRGGNLGQDVTYSGTVWAAMEGGLMGVPSLALSLVDDRYSDYRPAAAFAVKAAQRVREQGLPEGTILNINVPDNPDQDIDRFLITHQGFHRWEENVIESSDPRGKNYYWIGGTKLPYKGDTDTDLGAISAGYISVTPLHVDMTNYSYVDQLSRWQEEA